MKMFKKKPVAVKAVQWFPPDDPRYNAHEFPISVEVHGAAVGTITKAQPLRGLNDFMIKTVSGWVLLSPGDWIITGPATEAHPRDVYPCKPDVFEATYEPVENDA